MAHTYILGQSGTGKSTVLKQRIIDRIHAGHGVFYLDPHGHDTDELLQYIPRSRRSDVILFDPSREDDVLPFNPLEGAGNQALQASILLDTIKDAWGYGEMPTPLMDMYLYFSLAALADRGEPLLGLPYLLSHTGYRSRLIKDMTDRVIKDFWLSFNAMNPKEQRDQVSSTLNKALMLVADPRIRRMLARRHSAFQCAEVVKDKILFARLPQGQLSIGRTRLLGSVLLSLIHQACLLRDTTVPFHIVLDECFVTGTRVLTPTGYRPIEALKSGDTITNPFGNFKVLSTSSRRVSRLYRLKLSVGKELVVTAEHPLLTNRGWVKVCDITTNDVLLHHWYVTQLIYGKLPYLRKGEKFKANEDVFKELWSEVCMDVFERSQTQEYRQPTPKTSSSGGGIFATDEAKEPNGGPTRQSQNVSDTEENWSPTKSSWRKWASNARITADAFGIFGSWLVRRTLRINDTIPTDGDAYATALQNRHRKPDADDSDRDRRGEPYALSSAVPRQEEGAGLKGARVVSVEVIERPSLDSDALDFRVHNLHVEGHPSYIVENIVAHNCHQWSPTVVREMLSGIRKFNVTITLAHQYIDQLDPAYYAAIIGNCAEQLVFRTSMDDAHRMARRFNAGGPNGLKEEFDKLPNYVARQFPFDQRTPDLHISPLSRQPYRRSESDIMGNHRVNLTISREAGDRAVKLFLDGLNNQ